MPRDIPVGNGQMLVTFDRHYQIRDLYFPHVGQENHAGAGPCRFGVYASIRNAADTERRKRRLFWTTQNWQIQLTYEPNILATHARLTHQELAIELRCCDVVDFHRSIMVRRIEVHNPTDRERTIRLFQHHDFNMFGTKVGDTAYFDPVLGCLIHYRQKRYLMAGWVSNDKMRIDEYATGSAGFRGAEGTWRDAEDGALGNNTIAQGAVDSTMMLKVHVKPGQTSTVYQYIGAGHDYADMVELHRFLNNTTPQGVIDRTNAYWRLWLDAARTSFPSEREGGLGRDIQQLYKRSLLILRTQIDNNGAILAANDSDIMQFQRDTYSYLWPRDGALVAAALDTAGFPDVARSFYSFCRNVITDEGYFLHKYNPDGSPASSWHPWINMGQPQLPIQEDETALVIWALWRHYEKYRDIEFVRPLWVHLITKAADFLVRFRDPDLKLPLPSYDLWEERWGIHGFTVATVYGALTAAARFAGCFGDGQRAQIYTQVAYDMKQAFCQHMWCEKNQRFMRRVVPLDHDRTAKLMACVMTGQDPTGALDHIYPHHPTPKGEIDPPLSRLARREFGKAGKLEEDATVDSSLYAIFAMDMLEVDDPRVEATMSAVETHLTCKTRSGGIARYENDDYHRMTGKDVDVPGNPWFICTLWLAQWRIAKARSIDELREAMPIFNWVVKHALPSGVLAEQVHPLTNEPLSVSPLTWSHATVVSTVDAYLSKVRAMTACPTCGQPQVCLVHNHQPIKPTASPSKATAF